MRVAIKKPLKLAELQGSWWFLQTAIKTSPRSAPQAVDNNRNANQRRDLESDGHIGTWGAIKGALTLSAAKRLVMPSVRQAFQPDPRSNLTARAP